MDKLTKSQFERVLNSMLFVFDSNYHRFSDTDDVKKAFKFMAQAACQSLANNTNSDADIINPILHEALDKILKK